MLIFDLSELKTVATALGRVVPARPAHWSCGYVRLQCDGGTARLMATDSQVWLQGSMPVEGQADVLLPGRLFCDAVWRLQGETLQLELAGTQAKVTAGGSQFLLNTAESEYFPELPEPDGHSLEIPGSLLKECVRRVAVCASSDQTRGVLCGVRLEWGDGVLELAATDGYTLARTRVSLPGFETMALTVPTEGMQELVRLPGETVKLTFSQSYLLAEVPGYRLATRLLDGSYPTYRRLLPGPDFQPKTTARLARKDLVEALSRVELVAQKDKDKVKLEVNDGLVLSATAPDLGSVTESVPAQVEGSPIEVAVNLRYLTRFLGAAGDTVEVWLTAPNQALFWRTDADPEYMYLLMPILLQ
jgi:DNA polymerase-3 subunit beta